MARVIVSSMMSYNSADGDYPDGVQTHTCRIHCLRQETMFSAPSVCACVRPCVRPCVRVCVPSVCASRPSVTS